MSALFHFVSDGKKMSRLCLFTKITTNYFIHFHTSVLELEKNNHSLKLNSFKCWTCGKEKRTSVWLSPTWKRQLCFYCFLLDRMTVTVITSLTIINCWILMSFQNHGNFTGSCFIFSPVSGITPHQHSSLWFNIC